MKIHSGSTKTHRTRWVKKKNTLMTESTTALLFVRFTVLLTSSPLQLSLTMYQQVFHVVKNDYTRSVVHVRLVQCSLAVVHFLK